MKYKFVPAYYEWHLIDTTTDTIIFALGDPDSYIYEMKSVEEAKDFIRELIGLTEAQEDPAFNWLTEPCEVKHSPLSDMEPSELDEVVELMATTLYEHYLGN